MLKKILLISAVLLTLTACRTSENISGSPISAANEVSETSQASYEKSGSSQNDPYGTDNSGPLRTDNSVPVITEYDVPGTFEYTEDILQQMNQDDYEFAILHEEDGNTCIEGKINTSPVHNERDVIEQLMLVRSVLGLVNPKEQLVFSPQNSSNETYKFKQYHAGIPCYSSTVIVNTDPDTGMINLINSNVITTDNLKTIQTEPKFSAEDISAKYKQKYPDIKIEKIVIWDIKEYNTRPVLAYIAESGDDTVFLNADNGELIDLWPNILT